MKLLLLLSYSCCCCFEFSEIQVIGNKRLDICTILEYASIKKNKKYSQEELDESIKLLFKLDAFKDIKYKKEGGKLIIIVEENPTIHKISFEGNEKIKREDIKNELQIKSGEPFTASKIQDAQQRLLEIYRRLGRFNASVVPKIIKRKDNRVDVVFEIKEGHETYVEKITFIGNNYYTSNILEDLISIKRKRWFNFLSNNYYYDPDRFKSDQDEISKFYYDNGFLDFQILSANAELTPDGGSFILTFKLKEGKPYKIGKVKLSSEIKGINKNKVKELIFCRTGDAFDGQEIDKIIEQTTDELSDQGFQFAKVDIKLEKNKDKKIVDVTFSIISDEKKYVETIEFKNNHHTKDYVMRREMLLQEGDALNSTRLKYSEQRLKDLGYFKKVTIEQEEGSSPDKTNLIVNVEEESSASMFLSGGYSTLDGPLANFKFTNKNFRGTGQILSLDLTWAKKSQDFSLGLEEPYFLGKKIAASGNIFHTRSKRIEAYTHKTIGFDTGITYPLSASLSQGWVYGLKGEKISNIDKDTSPILYKEKRNTVSSWVSHLLFFDKRDSKLNPTKGYKCGVNTTYSGVGGSVNYLRNTVSFGTYKSIYGGAVLSFLGEAGTVTSTKKHKEVRIADNFWLGEQTFRGFDFGGIGPHDYPYIENKNKKKKVLSHDPLGGKRYWKGTVETLFPLGLPDDLEIKGAVFTDFGCVWGTQKKNVSRKYSDGIISSNIRDSKKIRISPGVGLAWSSPIGPIRLDFGFPIKKAKIDSTRIFTLSTQLFSF